MSQWLCLLATLSLLAGCATGKPSLSVTPGQSVVFSDDALAQALEVKRRACADAKAVQQTCLTLINRSQHSQWMRYRFYWYDKQGLQIEASPSEWQRISLPAKASKRINTPVPTASATQYRMVIVH
ncbi:YcfL family protein [Salinivibrio kushneri]|uniref:YcfL family protein n=1 Tax=Salinivibrio kushneri TaxID=1908198 RepID=A0AA47LQZ2_9GAMM|nr:YcfL family protein [Salinivibrio kushneri]WBA07652.1 YcfL family protein [Salinivibrio kushneri]